jgi:hypothetical protein
VTSPEFFSHAAYRAKVKNPAEFVLSARRALGVAPDTSSEAMQTIGQLGQPAFGRLTPDGWPDVGATWINSGSIYARMDLAERIANGKLPSVAVEQSVAWKSLAGLAFDRQVDGVVRLLLGGSVSAETRSALAGVRPDGGADATPANRERALRDLLIIALGSPEFQRK